MVTRKMLTHGIWFNNEAEPAAKFYTEIFNGHIENITRYGKEGFEYHQKPEGSVMTINFEIGGLGFTALNGGPRFKINPSISFFVVCETVEETNNIWEQLSQGGMVMMEIDKYPWSERYGWLKDTFGLTWQISFGKISDVGQKITPSLMFTQKYAGRAEEAIRFYTSIFKNSGVTGILKYEKDEPDVEGTVKHAQFTLGGQTFMAMDSSAAHKFIFNEAVTIMINCISQEEIDYYWNALSKNGEEGTCGWLKDQFGVSWQVESVRLNEMLLDKDKEKVKRVSEAMLQMKKFDIATLEKAYNV